MRTALRALVDFLRRHTFTPTINAVVTVVVTAVLVGGYAWIRSWDDEEVIEIADVRASLVKEGYEVRTYKRLQLRPEVASHLLILRRSNSLAADEVRIYDQEGAGVSPALRFRPVINHPKWLRRLPSRLT